MWADNETDVDLLGFDFLVDELLALLKEPAIFPVTIGLTGDWGSGKSSVLKMTAAALESDDAYRALVVRFSPWQFEGYEDVKSALMATVLESLREAVEADKTAIEKSRELLARLIQRVNWLTAARMVAKAAIAAQAGVPPDITEFASADLIRQGDTPKEPALSSVSEFRADFEELLKGLEDVRALVVFVDDLDRCLPPTVIETFEAIRLFLHVPKAAYVIAADERVVQAAIEHRYPSAARQVSDLGKDYLEKLLQIKVLIPPLSAPEAESYINLLFAQTYATPEEFVKLCDAAQQQREKGYLAVAMNFGMARDALGAVNENLTEGFSIAGQIAPVLARQLRGNPRQLKRFLNTLMLRQRAAGRRGVTLALPILAKLMVLEEVDLSAFSRLFRWQAAQDGHPLELRHAEGFARTSRKPEGITEDAIRWASSEVVAEWLRLDPPLAEANLAPYFFFSRERLTLSVPAARLSPDLQELLGHLDSPIDATRTAAVGRAVALDPEDRSVLYAALVDRMVRGPGARSTDSAIEMAARDTKLVPDLTAALMRIPAAALPAALAMKLELLFKPVPEELAAAVARAEKGGSRLAARGAARARARGARD